MSSVSSAASNEIERFDLITAQQEARPLIAALQKSSEKNLAALKSVPAYKRKDFPDRLTSRGQDIVEPLLQLADIIGGDYPARARQALVAVFDDVGKEQREIAIQLLRDIRQIFQHHGWPDNLPTAVLLDELRALSGRPWEIDGPMTKHTLARLLRPYEIRPRMLRSKLSKGTTSGARGYLQAHFVDVWKDLVDTPVKTPAQEQTPQLGPQHARVGQPPSAVSSVSSAPTSSVPLAASSVKNSLGPQEPGSPARVGFARDGVQGPDSPSRAAVAGDGMAEIPNKDAACCNVAETQIDPRIKGILDDPRNYYRQYPDEFRNWIADKVDEYEWPNPADNQNRCLHGTGMHGGYSIPFSCINTPPWNNDRPQPRAVTARSPRFPVTLNRQERIQVALARLYEIRATRNAQSR